MVEIAAERNLYGLLSFIIKDLKGDMVFYHKWTTFFYMSCYVFDT